MTVTVRGEDLQIFFQYGEEPLPSGQGTTRTIYCAVKNKSTEEILCDATVKCHPNDTFCKVVGRKAALARALRGTNGRSPFTKLQRTRIWLSYMGTHRFSTQRGPLKPREIRAMRNSLKARRTARVAQRQLAQAA